MRKVKLYSVLGWSLLSLLYWHVFRRVCQDAILFRINAKRDKLRSLAIASEISSDSFEYEFLESRLCQTAYVSPEISIYNFVRFYLSSESKTPSSDLEKFNNVASEELKALWSNAIDDVKYMMLINSPILSLVSLVVVVGIIIRGLQHKTNESVRQFFEFEMVEHQSHCATT